MIVQSQPPQFGPCIDRPDLVHGHPVIKRGQHRDQPAHDHRIAVATKGKHAAIGVWQQPDLRGAAVNFGRGHLECVLQRLQPLAQINHMTVTIFPIVKEFKGFRDIFKTLGGHACPLLTALDLGSVTPEVQCVLFKRALIG